jgi:hypothetical protein
LRTIAPGEAKFEDDVATLHVAEIAEPLSECVDEPRFLVVPRRQYANARDFD